MGTFLSIQRISLTKNWKKIERGVRLQDDERIRNEKIIGGRTTNRGLVTGPKTVKVSDRGL